MTKSSLPDFTGQRIAFFGGFSYWPAYHGMSPADLASRLGAEVVEKVDEHLTTLVVGDRRGTGRSEAVKRAQRLNDKKQASIEILDEGSFRELVRVDVAGQRFAFAGGFDCAPAEFDDSLLRQMVTGVGGVAHDQIDETLDFLVLGNRRAEGKTRAQRQGEALIAAGAKLRIIGEDGFRELVRVDKPAAATLDFGAFMGQLLTTVDTKKLARAMAMLKKERFKLYAKATDERLVGVVRSQGGGDTVYSSWLQADGRYGCNTPDLADCMGLQGSPCKHLLVLLIGVTRAGELDPSAACAWIRGAQGKRPKSDQNLAADTFLQYRGAEAGEVDWRPTETLPEDYYAY